MNKVSTVLCSNKISKRLFIISSILMAAILASLYGYVFLNIDQVDGQSLVTTAQCPSCNGLITMWDQTASSNPSSVHCPECDEIIQESFEYFGILKVAAITSFVLIVLTIIASAATKAWRRMVCSLIVFLIYWALLELGTNLLIFNYAKLTVAQ